MASLDQDRILRRYLELIEATLRTNAWQRDPRRAAQGLRLLQVRPGARSPACRCRGRPSRSSSTRPRRGRAPARRQGRARRPALVRPPRGLPHRGPGPDEGADGQERGDRAGGRQGRLRRQAAARRRRPRGVQEEAIRCYSTFLRGPARHHRQPARRRAWCRRTDVVRYDGDDPYLVVAADKGTATFSDIANARQPRVRLLARRRLRVGRLRRLRPQGHGHHRPRRVGIGQAPLPRARAGHPDAAVHGRRRRRHVGRRVRQRHAAVASRSGSSPPSTTATSSSTPIPTRRARSPSASGCSTCRARAGPTTTAR